MAAKFEGDWYRAEVVVSGRETLKVRYIDYGNESEVVQGDIRSLTHLETIMPQVKYDFCCVRGKLIRCPMFPSLITKNSRKRFTIVYSANF